MARTTNNGWPKDPALERIYIGADPDGATVRQGDVARAFQWLGDQIHRRVERVTVCNGARTTAFNASVGGAAGSNHVSATALDINGHLHPYEIKQAPALRYGNYRHGWSGVEIAAIRQILREADGLFSWGLDYAAPYRDAMHFDITKGKTAADVAAFLRKISGAPAPAPQPPKQEDDMFNDSDRATLNTVLSELGRIGTRLKEIETADESVRVFYEDYLGPDPRIIDRPVSQRDVDQRVLEVAKGSTLEAQRLSIANSAEAKAARVAARRLAYVELLGRSANETEASFSENTPVTIQDIWDQVAASAEAQNFAKLPAAERKAKVDAARAALAKVDAARAALEKVAAQAALAKTV